MSPLAHRYVPVVEGPRDARAPVRARDVVFDRFVALESLGPDFRRDPLARERLDSRLRALHGLPAPHLVRYFAVEETEDESVLVREWVTGFSLLELLFRRRGLGMRECVQLLTPLPGTLDLIAHAGLPLPGTLLGKILFAAEKDAIPADLTEPVGGTPDGLQLKFDPICAGDFGGVARADVTVLAPRQAEAGRHGAADLLARLLHEVLGGRRRADAHFAPLAAVGERGNALLHAAARGEYADGTTFWSHFTQAVSQEDAAAATHAPRRPYPPLAWEAAGRFAPATPADVLHLVPDQAGAIPIRLVARPVFRLGRAHYEADFTTRLQPETEENYERTGRIGPVHVRGEIIGGQVHFRDGNGSKASNHGSWFNGHRLTTDAPGPVGHRGVLDLAGEYRLEAVPLLHDHLDGCRFNDFSAATALIEPPSGMVSTGPSGGVVFIPLDGQRPLAEAIWLFTGIGFGLDRDGLLVWDYHGEGDSPGAFLHHKACFWIKNSTLPDDALGVDGVTLSSRQIAPLAPGQTLRLGARTYRLQAPHVDA